ncbi:translation initiation factor IF-2 subunit gamma [[Eubacterium] cellulosolvens]
MVVKPQPEINIGLVGHVDHGKTTLTKALSGVWTDRHSEEIKRGISIRLGYADTSFYKCPSCPEPQCYTVEKTCAHCGGNAEFLRSVSFVDAPGHETLMATMLSGAALMNSALLLIAANEPCPQPQTKEHLMGLDILGVKDIIIIQNKIDLVDNSEALENYHQIKEFVKGTCAENAPIIPISAHHEGNIDVLIMTMEKSMPSPPWDETLPPKLYIARSFDVNKPGSSPEELVGGIIGGSLIQGKLQVGDEVEIRPGRRIDEHGKIRFEDITSTITGLLSGKTPYNELRPGGLIAVGTNLDPAITKSDSMVGKLAGKPGTLPEILTNITLEVNLFESIVGTADDVKVESIRSSEPLMINSGSATTVGIAKSARENVVDLVLKIPICADPGTRVAISRKVESRWRLIGYGIIQ